MKSDLEDSSPGRRLRDLLRTIYPLENTDSFVSKIDHALNAEGDLVSYSYESLINYMTRRFINTAEYIRRKFKKDERGFLLELKSFVRNNTRIPRNQVDRVTELLRQCSEAVNDSITEGEVRDSIRQARDDGMLCYICGCKLEFLDRDSLSFAEAEHHWPHQMGGINEKTNVKAACRRCNRDKKNYIDSSDYHFEHISLKTEQDDDSFSSEFRREYRIAVWAKNDFCCMNCGQPASRVGELVFTRREPSDIWHFLNIEAYCRGCLKLLRR